MTAATDRRAHRRASARAACIVPRASVRATRARARRPLRARLALRARSRHVGASSRGGATTPYSRAMGAMCARRGDATSWSVRDGSRPRRARGGAAARGVTTRRRVHVERDRTTGGLAYSRASRPVSAIARAIDGRTRVLARVSAHVGDRAMIDGDRPLDRARGRSIDRSIDRTASTREDARAGRVDALEPRAR